MQCVCCAGFAKWCFHWYWRQNSGAVFEKGKPTDKVWYYQLNVGRNMGKTNPLNEKDLAEFVEMSSSMWKTVTLGEICDVLDKLCKPITKKDRISGDYPYYGATGIVDWVHDYIFDEKLILVGKDGAKWGAGDATAFIATGKYWVNNHAHVLRPKPDLVMHEWISYYLTGIDLSEFVTGLTVPKLNQANLKTILIPLPPLAEQQRIVAKLDAAFAEIDDALSLTRQREVALTSLKSSILSNELKTKDD